MFLRININNHNIKKNIEFIKDFFYNNKAIPTKP